MNKEDKLIVYQTDDGAIALKADAEQDDGMGNAETSCRGVWCGCAKPSMSPSKTYSRLPRWRKIQLSGNSG